MNETLWTSLRRSVGGLILRGRGEPQSWGFAPIWYLEGKTWLYSEPGSLQLIWRWKANHYTARLVWKGRMGYTDRWRWLAPLSTRFKVARFQDDC